MSYSVDSRAGYVPSYSQKNTGSRYMKERGWNNPGQFNNHADTQSNISFSGKSSTKRLVIASISILCFLLLAAIVIIILFATGVLSSSSSDDEISPTSSPITGPPFPPLPTFQPLPPPIQNRTYSCSFLILRQANSAYTEKSSPNFQTAFRKVRDTLVNVIYQSTLQPLGVNVILDDLRNSGDDLQVVFRLVFPSTTTEIQPATIASVLGAERTRLEAGIGGNVQIDPNGIFVTRTT